MDGEALYQRNIARRFSEIMPPANIGFAVAYALFSYVGCSRIPAHAPVRMQGFLEAFTGTLRSIAPLSGHTHWREALVRREIVEEIVFISIMFGVMLPIYFLAAALARITAGRFAASAISAVTAIAAVPLCWLYIVYATWGVRDQSSFWDAYGFVALVELVGSGVLLVLVRNRSTYYGMLVVAVHYVFWVVTICERDNGNFIAPIIVSLPLSLVFPGSALVWLSSVRTRPAGRVGGWPPSPASRL
ncbi:MAG: hypothetical protein WBD25_20290 [Terriglobales bacterium]|jgi:hypothetical protein